MIPIKTIDELIVKHATLEKELSSGEIDKKLFAEKSKEYSDINEIINIAKKYISFENDKRRNEIKNKDLFNQKKIIDRRFDDHENFMQNVMSIEPAPYLKLIAVFYREG